MGNLLRRLYGTSVERSPVLYESMAEAAKEGKKALTRVLATHAARLKKIA